MKKVNDVVQIIGGANHGTKRNSNDFYATPIVAVEKLLNNFKDFDKDIPIFDPCVGKGHCLKPFRDRGYIVHGVDLIERQDYFDNSIKYTGGQDFIKRTESIKDNIVSNPPYNMCKEFVEHGMDLLSENRYMVMLLKLQFLETKKRYELFKKYPPKYVYVFVNRIGCIPEGEGTDSTSSAICYAWYVWQKGFKGEPVIRWIE